MARGQTADVLTRSACHFCGPDAPQRTGTIVSSHRTVGSKVTVNCRWPGKLRIARLYAPISADGRNLHLRYIRRDVFPFSCSVSVFLFISLSLSLPLIGDPCLMETFTEFRRPLQTFDQTESKESLVLISYPALCQIGKCRQFMSLAS